MTKIDLWKKKRLTLTDRLQTKTAAQREGVNKEVLQNKIERGDLTQELRLRYYPSIEVDFSDLYAGTFEGSLDELEEKLFQIGYRNNPSAYVEITDRFGPDDGSYSRQLITESGDFPYLGSGRPLGVVTWWNRVKLQVHATVFIERDNIHILAHREASAWLQPARHLTVSEGSGKIGVEEFRNQWFYEFGSRLPSPLG